MLVDDNNRQTGIMIIMEVKTMNNIKRVNCRLQQTQTEELYALKKQLEKELGQELTDSDVIRYSISIASKQAKKNQESN